MSSTFSVITPCFNASRWIRSCIASVADQEGVVVEHIVQDGLSTDGTAEYLRTETRVRAEIGKDQGMYDAINKGWAKCTGEFVLHLNADEELLPGALQAVASYFQTHPEVDVVLSGNLICEADGAFHCYRKPLRPSLGFLVTSHLPTHTCSTFLRRSSFAGREWLYDPKFRLLSDALFMIDILRQRKKLATLDRFTSVFFLTGANLGLTQSERAQKEYEHLLGLATPSQRALRHLIKLQFRLKKLLTGHYSQGPLSYDIYMPGSSDQRTHMSVDKPSGIYRPELTRQASA